MKYCGENREHHIRACTDCGAGVSNDDWSHLDNLEPEDSDSTMATIEATLETLGHLSHKETVDIGGYYNCELCGEVTIGSAHVFVTADYFYQTEPPRQLTGDKS